MKIKVRGIPFGGLNIKKSIEPSEIGLSDEDMTCLSPLEITAKIERIRNSVIAQVEVKTRLAFSCVRCLEDVEREYCENYKFDYEVTKDVEFIDIGDDIRQEMIMSPPTKILCRDDCRGICLHCGAHLNEEECRCGK